MPEDEVRVPKGVRDVMPDWAEPTVLGTLRGARRQYRYGNLHIREYDDVYAVHVDAVDPRKDKLGHLVHDAPEVLVGAGCGLATGVLTYKALAGVRGTRAGGEDGGGAALAAASAAALASGCAAYEAARRIRRRVSELRSDGGGAQRQRQQQQRQRRGRHLR